MGGSISLAIFDDRVEVWSAGRLPPGITSAELSHDHDSVLRNRIIADVFHRMGLIEKWGRGTNRVITLCKEAGISAPEFRETGTSTVVTFRVPVGVTRHAPPQVTPQVAPQVLPILDAAERSPCSRDDLQEAVGLKDRKHFRRTYLSKLLRAGWMEMTIPDKPGAASRSTGSPKPAGLR